MFFVLVVFLQQTAGYTALEAGAATIPTTVAVFLVAKRCCALADRHGPRGCLAAGLLALGGAVGRCDIRDPRRAQLALRDPQLVGSD